MDAIAVGLGQISDSRFLRPTKKDVNLTTETASADAVIIVDGGDVSDDQAPVSAPLAADAPLDASAPVADSAETAGAPPAEHVKVSDWQFAHGLKLNVTDPTTQIPLIDQEFPVIDPKRYVWDTWALRDIFGKTIEYKGWKIVFSLVADRGQEGDDIFKEWHDRNNYSYIAYYYSRSGDTYDWKCGGNVITKGANKRDWEWSGSAMMREGTDNTIDLFFTSVNGTPNESVVAHVAGKIYADENGVTLAGFDEVTDLFQADGIHYSSVGQNPYRDFRDPHVFVDPSSDRCFVLFEGDMPGMRGALKITDEAIGTVPPGYTVPAGGVWAAGCIGIGECISDWKNGDFTKWRLYDPLISALPVTGQTERPHVVFKDGLTYIFTICHHAFFAPGLTGADGVYGFVSHNGLFGKYEPLNGSGLVLANPPEAPFQTYSHFVDPQGYVIAFIDTLPAAGQDAYNPQKYRIGGTQAPTLKLNLQGNSTFLESVWGYGQIFAQRDWNTDHTADTFPEGVAKPEKQGIVAE